jgi:hypothetical protein
MTDDEIRQLMTATICTMLSIKWEDAATAAERQIEVLRNEGCEIVRWRPIGEMTQPQYDRYRENGHFDSLPAIAVGGDHFCTLTGPESNNG